MANPWRYTGQYQVDATGLYKIGARYYQGDLGRWTQPDPSGLDANAYAYAASDPINNSDPTGLFCITGTYGGPGGGCRGGRLNERETLEQIAFGQAVKLAVTSVCVAAVGAATAGTALVAGTFACAAAGTAAGLAANKNVDVGIKK